MKPPPPSLLALALLMGACIVHPRGGPLPLEGLADGSYEGRAVSLPNSATVRVRIEDGRMTEVEIVRHNASRRGHVCDVALPERMVEQQSTVVDAITGATNSSHVLMTAAHRALKKAERPE
jgi:fumarate reductase flavoprotein subunit